jgi:hypothetical protein
MGRWILAAALLASAPAMAVDSSNFQLNTAGDLVQACSVKPDHPLHANAMGFCHGVLVGAYRFYESTVKAEDRFVCPPSVMPTRAKVMNDFVAWAGSRPQYMKDAPVDTLFRYLAEAYPCRK